MIYLSIGSNLGNRIQYLQQAVDMIQQQIGKVKQISSVWESPSWGFSSFPFLNACIAIESPLSPIEILEKIQAIEKKLGREKNNPKQGYQARTIDIDLIFYHKQTLQLPNMTLPHPNYQKRAFVLLPLSEIMENMTPDGQNISQLLENCPERKELIVVEEKLSASEE